MKVILCSDINWLFSKEAFSIYASCMYQPTYEDYKIQMKRFFSDPFVKIFVCEKQNIKIGMLVLKQSNLIEEIVGIAVKKKHRCQGIGKYMIYSVMESEQLKRIYVQTDDEAIGFYRHCGFSEERIIIKYPDGSTVRYNCSLNRLERN